MRLPHAEWNINEVKKETSNFEIDNENNNDSDRMDTEQDTGQEHGSSSHNNDCSGHIGWQGVQLMEIEQQFYSKCNLKNWILLDNQSTTNIFSNKSMVENMCDTNKIMKLDANAGSKMSTEQCEVPDFQRLKTIWFNDDTMTNILSFGLVRDAGYDIDYDKIKDEFIITADDNKKYIFQRKGTNLCFYIPNEDELIFVETIDENKKFYSKQQFARAKQAQTHYHAMGSPSTPDLKATLTMNLVKNNPITLKDINIMEAIFGKDIATLKGKTTRRKPIPALEDYIDIPKELTLAQRNVIICVDGITVNSLKFLNATSKDSYYRTSHYMPHTTTYYYNDAIEQLINF